MLSENIKKNIEEFIEKGADLEHTRWSKWQEYMHGFCIEKTITPPETANMSYQAMTFPKKFFDRWQKQINTQYKNLTEKEKESDRKEVEVYIPLLKQAQLSLIDSIIEGMEKSSPKIELKYRKDFEGMSLPEIANYRTQLGAYLAVQEQIDRLKAERAIIEK